MEDTDATSTPPPHDPASSSDVHTHRLPVVARSVGAARHWLAERPLRGVSLRNAQLVLSELVTNAIIHAGLDEARDEIEVTLRPTPSGVRIEVLDQGPGFTPPPPDDPGRGATLAGGHGLTIVGRLVDRWGVDRTRGTCVWFEMDRR